MGLFISFEGGDGAGKSTQVALLVERLRVAEHTVCPVQEPGGTPLGENLRAWLKGTNRNITDEAELLLFAAARAELVHGIIAPALASGAVVVADRYADSTTVYQGYGRGIPMRQVNSVNRIATAGCWPKLTVLLDIEPQVGLARGVLRDEASDETRFERAGIPFHQRVRDGFRRLARREPERWLVLGAAQPRDELAEQIWQHVEPLLTN